MKVKISMLTPLSITPFFSAFLFAFLFTFLFAFQAGAAVMKPFTGTVTSVSPNKVEVQNGQSTMDYIPEKDKPLAKGIKVGAQVTIYSSHGDQKIKLAPKKKQEAGQVGHEIMDDRAFYSADANR